MFPPLSLPVRNWIQPVMEGPPRAGTIVGCGSAAFRHADSGLVSGRRLMFPILILLECLPFSLSHTGFIYMLPGENTFTISIKNQPVFVNR